MLTRNALAHTLLNYGAALRQQRRFEEAINSFKEVIVLSQSHNTAIEVAQQAALELSEAQIFIAAKFQRKKDIVNTAQEEKKVFTANLQAEPATPTRGMGEPFWYQTCLT